MTYAQWLEAWVTILNTADAQGTAAMTAIAPRAINYAELRIYREFDFLYTRDVDLTQMTTGGIRAVAIPAQFVIIEGVNLITPAGKRPTQSGAKRVPLTRADRSYIDFIWPTETLTAEPDPLNGGWWAPYSMQQAVGGGGQDDEVAALPSDILIAPTPDDEYIVEFSGTVRPAPLSETNTTTFLTTYMEDIFLAATLIWGFGYQRDFGGQSSDSQTAVSWEAQYQALKEGVAAEELRKKALGYGFSPYIPAVRGVQSQGAQG